MEKLESHLESITSGVIAIDGELGAGKTTLSEKIERRYGLRVVHVDDYIDTRKEKYVSALDIHDLKEDIEDGNFPVVLEGVCLLDVLSKIEYTPKVHLFVYRNSKSDYEDGYPIVREVEEYIRRTKAPQKSDVTFAMNERTTNALDVDKTYIKSKTVVSAFLSLGGVVALLVGAYILSSGISTQSSAVFKFLGAEVTTEGIGAVIMSSSVFWAYFAYLARPQYSRQRETRSSTSPDGGQKRSESVTATMAATMPPSPIERLEVPQEDPRGQRGDTPQE